MADVLETLKRRGFLQQMTDEASLSEILASGPTTFYVGFDATAPSLHAGSLVPIMAMAHLQRAGHRPIALLGTGTTLIGDPSGKTESRPLLSREEIARNKEGIRANLENFLALDGEKGLLLENGTWLEPLKYLDFLREIGRHFSVNRMLAAETYKIRLETGLSFLEFNYQVLQAYDFLVLYRDYGCRIQAGGDDQWGNMVAGTDLIRRVMGPGAKAEAMTFPLLTTASGAKMGKTEKGAVWLSAERFSPYDYYQFWINADDRDVRRFLLLFTFLPEEEVEALAALQGAEIRKAKETLAFEATRLLHGDEEAQKAREASRALFGGAGDASRAPTCILSPGEADQEMDLPALFVRAGLCKSRSEARRLILQGGAYLDGERVKDLEKKVDLSRLDPEKGILLRAGKKKYCRVIRAPE